MQTLIKTSQLLDGTGTTTKLEWSLLVSDGLIIDLGPRSHFEGIEAEILDLSDGFVVPGFLIFIPIFVGSTKPDFNSTLSNRTRLP